MFLILGVLILVGFWYTLFEVESGWFGILAGDGGVCRTALPLGEGKVEMEKRLVGLYEARYDRGLLKQLQERISAYFAGVCVEFGDVEICLDGVSEFGAAVLGACRQVGYGERISYGQLAEAAGKKGASRAVGAVLGKNPVPLIVPCHRVIKSDGSIGGFMRGAKGGVSLKEWMIDFESS